MSINGLSSNEVEDSLARLRSTFEGNYGALPLFEGEKKVGRIYQQDQKIYLTFRGTVNSFTEPLSCLHLRKFSLEKWGLAGNVHAGIYNSFCQVQRSIDTYLGRILPHLDPRTEFLIEGYSRGSALAMLTAAYLADKVGKERIRVLTFSSMNIFDEEGAKSYGEKVIHHLSFICEEDFLPRWFGPACLGFYSVGKKLLFSAASVPSFLERVRIRAYTHLTTHWLVGPITRFFVPLRLWEAHMPETYESGAPLALERSRAEDSRAAIHS